MNKENARRCAKLMLEIDQLSNYKKIITDKKQGTVAHFEFRQHYGNNPDSIQFATKYNSKFIAVVEEILKELDDELESL